MGYGERFCGVFDAYGADTMPTLEVSMWTTGATSISIHFTNYSPLLGTNRPWLAQEMTEEDIDDLIDELKKVRHLPLTRAFSSMHQNLCVCP
jgi:hypothetical protein